MKLIPLSQGQFAMVDGADYAHYMQWKWHALWHKQTLSFYARRNQNVARIGEKWKNSSISLHRDILGLISGDKRQGEHINGDTLDCQRHNLRIATNSQNAMNRKRMMANNTSGHKGVYFRKGAISNPWGAFVKIKGKMIHLGFRSTFEEAVKLRVEGEDKYYGEFTRRK